MGGLFYVAGLTGLFRILPPSVIKGVLETIRRYPEVDSHE